MCKHVLLLSSYAEKKSQILIILPLNLAHGLYTDVNFSGLCSLESMNRPNLLWKYLLYFNIS